MLRIQNLNKTFYPGTPEEHKIFQDLNIEIEENVCTTIIGPNGCGKSTLFNLISGSLEADSGKLSINGLDLNSLAEEERAKYIGKVSQDPAMGVASSLNILENMSIALKKGENFKLRNLLKNTNKDLIIKKLKELGLGLEEKLNTQVKYLSGGQKQSLALLMATVKSPKLLLLDEHTAALDPKTSKLIMEKTEDLIAREKITTLMISHNLKHAIEFSDRIIMLKDGEIVLDVKSKDIDEKTLITFYNEAV
ncbi:MAG: ATP-binding cassette domain-containing protein [Tissierellia bacterium]|jgi:putative ABC transport system ATP-binding protein|nr:ATP-binding cassette domain-containing protein [Tissierellia bacterium]